MTPAAATTETRPPFTAVLLRTGAALAGLMFLAGIAVLTDQALFALPFAATAGIIAMAPASPFAQPRAILLGHVSAAILALALTSVVGPSIWTAAAAAALSTAPMLLLRAAHPPAGATAALIGGSGPPAWFLLDPVLAGSLVVIVGGVLVGRILPSHRYPSRWW